MTPKKNQQKNGGLFKAWMVGIKLVEGTSKIKGTTRNQKKFRNG